jgi:DNA recombination protein RmuC
MDIMIPNHWLWFSAGVAAAVLVTGIFFWMVCYSGKRRFREELSRMMEDRDRIGIHRDEIAHALERERLQAAALRAELEAMERSWKREREEREAFLRAKESECVQLGRVRLDLEKELSEMRVRLEEERERNARSIEELKDARETMQREFKLLASRIMEENSRRFGEVSKERVEQLLKPLRQQVESFRRRVDEVHTEETREMAALLNEIKTLKELNRQIGEDAVSLTRALRGESKTRGIWGEMVLERVLEASGLREGEEYERELSLRDEERRRFRPDVIVHLPDDRDIVIDAKTSLVAYERYVNAETDEERARYAKAHLEAVKAHIDRLSDKSYTRLEGINTLDFLFMFMPIEGALMLALQEDPGLYDRAFGRGIVLVSPTTLLVALRAVENTWRRERQNRNALEIAKRAGALYDKFASFAGDMERIGKQLDTVQKSYDAAWKKLTAGRGNIVRQIEAIREMGAQTSKKLPRKLVEDADLEQDREGSEMDGRPEENLPT